MVDSTTKTRTRQSTTTTVTFPTLPSLSLQPMKIEVYQEEHQHDIAIFIFDFVQDTWFALLNTGVPVQFQWEQTGVTQKWLGYVSFVTKQVSSGLVQYMEVHCIGASFPLKERVSKVFENVTIPEAVGQIAADFGFNFVTNPHGLVFDQLIIAGHSYWEWIHEQAKRIGYGVFIDGMTLVFKPIDKLIEYGITNVPVFSMVSRTISANIMYQDRTLDYLMVSHGDFIESDVSLRTVKISGGVDPITGKEFSSAKSPKDVGTSLRSSVNDVLFSEIRSDQVIQTHQAAELLAEGAAQRGRMNMPAKIKGQGDPRLRVFSPLMVTGTGESTDGYWIAKKIKHMFSRNGNYQVEMLVAADGSGLSNKAYLRHATATVVGVVNLTEALNNGGTNVNTAETNAFRLTTPVGVTTELNQGFLRTKMRWVYSPASKGTA